MGKKQKFYSALKDLFVGAKLDGQGGYVNLMNIKTEYFNIIKKLIEEKVRNIDMPPFFGKIICYG